MEQDRFVTRTSADSGIKINSDPNGFWIKKRHFGAQNEGTIRVTRLRLVVLAFGVIIVALSGALLHVTRAKMGAEMPTAVLLAADPQASIESGPGVAMASTINTVDLLYARHSIDPGVQLSEEMFSERKVSLDETPENAYRADQREELIGKYARSSIAADQPLVYNAVSERNEHRLVAFHIPTGYRATTITVDGRAGVEGFARPGSYVDVLWFYQGGGGDAKVTRIIPSVKVLSVGGTTQHEGPKSIISERTTVTLLVSIKDAQIIELARNLGALSLSLVGKDDHQQEAVPNDGYPITVRDIIRRAQGTAAERLYVQGVLETVDTFGRELKYVLSDFGWIEADQDGKVMGDSQTEEAKVKKTWLAKYNNEKVIPPYSRGLLIRPRKSGAAYQAYQ